MCGAAKFREETSKKQRGRSGAAGSMLSKPAGRRKLYCAAHQEPRAGVADPPQSPSQRNSERQVALPPRDPRVPAKDAELAGHPRLRRKGQLQDPSPAGRSRAARPAGAPDRIHFPRRDHGHAVTMERQHDGIQAFHKAINPSGHNARGPFQGHIRGCSLESLRCMMS